VVAGVLVVAVATPGEAQAQGFFEKFNRDLKAFSDKMSSRSTGSEGQQPVDGAADGSGDGAQGMQAVDGSGSTPEDAEGQSNEPESLADLLDQSDEIRENIRRLKARMAAVLHRMRVSQMAIGEQYVALAEDMVAADRLFEQAATGEGSTLARLAEAARGTQAQARKITHFAMDYENEPDLKELVLVAHRNTRQIVDLQQAVRKLRGDYAEIFGRIDDELGGRDPASFRGQVARQKGLLRDVRTVGDRLTTPLIRRAEKGKVMLRHLSEEYGELYEEMQVAIAEFEDTGGRYSFQATKQIAVLTAHGFALANQVDQGGAVGIISAMATGISMADKLSTTIGDLQDFVEFNNWFEDVSVALVAMNQQVRDQIRLATSDLETVNAEVQGYRETLIARMQGILASQQSGVRSAAADYRAFKNEMQAAADKAAAKGRADGRAEQANFAEGMQSGFFAAGA
jgi:hypothetical protein